MKLNHALIATLAAVVVGAGGAIAATQIGDDDASTVDAAPAATPSATPSPSTSAGPVVKLAKTNLISEAVYADLTGNSFTRVDPDPKRLLGDCDFEENDSANKRSFSDLVSGPGVTTIESRLVANAKEFDGREVVQQLAQVGSAQEAKAAADEITTLVDTCAEAYANIGAQSGFVGPETMIDEPDRKIVYFRAFSADTAFGGLVVYSVGSRVGVLDVSDEVAEGLLIRLADKAATTAAA